ncbi:hypothetical protein PC116_g28466 [Phytophthora cactorum]|nr:hypothetical protein Pcac1_g26708 [Phytophthora cactorum]KAG3143263.1 hypothetical protein C6341_g19124 [Phytophthora cactorum]KAG4223062.1 hypothetical protein PC116_g28466 [Phytophthora cactorum]
MAQLAAPVSCSCATTQVVHYIDYYYKEANGDWMGVLLLRGLLLPKDFGLCNRWCLVAPSCACVLASTYRASPRSSGSGSS